MIRNGGYKSFDCILLHHSMRCYKINDDASSETSFEAPTKILFVSKAKDFPFERCVRVPVHSPERYGTHEKVVVPGIKCEVSFKTKNYFHCSFFRKNIKPARPSGFR